MEKRALSQTIKSLLRVGYTDRKRQETDERAWKAALVNRAYERNVPDDLKPEWPFPTGLSKHAARRY